MNTTSHLLFVDCTCLLPNKVYLLIYHRKCEESKDNCRCKCNNNEHLFPFLFAENILSALWPQQISNTNNARIGYSEDTKEKRIEVEEKELLLIVNPNTVTNPRTVMVHSYDTPVALSAVMDPWWFYGKARFAHF